MAKSPHMQARKSGVIGWPIAHSLSPRIHGYWLKQLNIPGEYGLVAIEPANLASGVAELLKDGWCGFNVTIPHKQTIIDYCQSVDATAQAIGAVNTVTIDPHGKLHGTNTDAYGFITQLDTNATIKPHQHAFVLGAGGAARAVVYALHLRGLKITLGVRNIAAAQELAARYNCMVQDINAPLPTDIDLLVNTTPLGMVGKDVLHIDLSPLPPHAIVYDLVYRPLETKLLTQAKSRNLCTIDGLGMLLHQAVPGFAAWFGQTPTVTEHLRNHVLAGLT